MDPNNEYRLSSWLAQQEDQHKISLYQCDLTVSAWTQRCIRQADCILIIGLGDNHPSLGKFLNFEQGFCTKFIQPHSTHELEFLGKVEKELERLAIRTQKELVLLHKEGGKPANTIGWLNIRSWVSSHHHIVCPNRVFARKSQYRIVISATTWSSLLSKKKSNFRTSYIRKCVLRIPTFIRISPGWLDG